MRPHKTESSEISGLARLMALGSLAVGIGALGVGAQATIGPAGTAAQVAAPPGTTIDSGPSGATADPTPTFTFSSNDKGASFQCRVDGARFTGCPSPHTTAALADGAHTFEVRAISDGGTVDPTPASRSFTVDTAAPETAIDSGPSGATRDPTPTFTFSSDESGSTFECRVDGAPFAGCSSPDTTPTLADGAHTFEVFATDAAGNADPSPASRTVTVDTTPPETTIDSGPSGATGDPTPTFSFTSNEPGSTFECRVDSAPFAGCSSPHTTATLASGAHTFEARATDGAGNVDPSPAATFDANAARRTFTVDFALPPPVLGKTFNVEPLAGDVFVSLPPAATPSRRGVTSSRVRTSASVPGLKGRTFIPLRQARHVPIGSLLDTRNGKARLSTARYRGAGIQSGNFSSGVFQVLQSRRARARGLTELRLKGASFKRCTSARGAVRASGGAYAAASRTIRRLRGSARGRFRTRGRRSAATVRGTIWTVADRCDGTLTTVKRGKVAVRDFRRRKTIVLGRGKRYLAKAPG